MKDMVKSLELAVSIVCCLLFGLILGYWLDLWLGIAPVMMIFGLLFGTGCAFMVLYRLSVVRNK